MNLNSLLRAVGLDDLTRDLWGDDAVARLDDRIDRSERQLRRLYTLLIQQRSIVEGLRHRLTENEKRQVRLAERVEVYHHVRDRGNAWKEALELEQTRRCIQRDREHVELHQTAYQQQLDDVARLKRRLASLREKLVLTRRCDTHRPR